MPSPRIEVFWGVAYNYRLTETFTAIADGEIATTNRSPKYFAVQVAGTDGTPTAWDARLEGSIDGVNFTQIMAHTQADGHKLIKWGGSLAFPVTHFRVRVLGLTLGPATNIVVTALGSL